MVERLTALGAAVDQVRLKFRFFVIDIQDLFVERGCNHPHFAGGGGLGLSARCCGGVAR